ncbi:cysteinyl-tRNA synthetase [Cereibacter ovatus]|uniref:Cysteine--tRNA ligase n=1 Tax=Cereibacter ovatus TaxID=439529 RepID=A0A285CJI2_9RHOB|nr:cysteine--tRNA ligase [Cereibacter ovatus]SNX67680.1 cysteinyl-tRNA synthetase [Cereibacter ovatus]
MTTIRLTNTKTRKKEVFTPIDPANVRLYVCGPTVYDRAHLGNGRPVVVFDVLFRLLRQIYGADHVTYVRNFTDVDDKINAAAQARKAAGDPRPLEDLIRERTDETIGWYHADMDALGALRPTAEPRATEWIGAMIAMIEDLIAKGHAYEAAGHVLFRVRSYRDYGALSGRSVDDMIAGARVEVAPFKEDPMDFVLWKPSDADLPGWESPWGRGRPGWHIECSAMSHELLGASFDIHAGGIDLQFPHHENEIAQSRCAHPEGGFANYWMHNEMLLVDGKKMSKSLGNFFTVRDLLDQGWPGEVIRMVYLGTHYGKPMDWTEEKAEQARDTLRKWRQLTENVEAANMPDPAVVAALANDLNTHGAIGQLHRLAAAGDVAGLKASANLLGLLTDDLADWTWRPVSGGVGTHHFEAMGIAAGPATVGTSQLKVFDLEQVEQKIAQVLTARSEARAARDYQLADQYRGKLLAAGVSVKDQPGGAVWELMPDFDPAKLEAIK